MLRADLTLSSNQFNPFSTQLAKSSRHDPDFASCPRSVRPRRRSGRRNGTFPIADRPGDVRAGRRYHDDLGIARGPVAARRRARVTHRGRRQGAVGGESSRYDVQRDRAAAAARRRHLREQRDLERLRDLAHHLQRERRAAAGPERVPEGRPRRVDRRRRDDSSTRCSRRTTRTCRRTTRRRRSSSTSNRSTSCWRSCSCCCSCRSSSRGSASWLRCGCPCSSGCGSSGCCARWAWPGSRSNGWCGSRR